jgi:hypothetical protein
MARPRPAIVSSSHHVMDARCYDAGHGGVARSLKDVPLPPPVITTTSPLAENRSVGLIGA